jgi:hypothetical protein
MSGDYNEAIEAAAKVAETKIDNHWNRIDVLEAIRSLRRPDDADDDGWRTMDDGAPKDGTRILIRFEHDNYKYASPEDRSQWEEVCIAHWIDHNDGGWTWHGICGIATHWRHLPAPPRQLNAGGR